MSSIGVANSPRRRPLLEQPSRSITFGAMICFLTCLRQADHSRLYPEGTAGGEASPPFQHNRRNDRMEI